MTTITLGAPSSTEGLEELTGRGLLPAEGHGRPGLVEGPRLYGGSAPAHPPVPPWLRSSNLDLSVCYIRPRRYAGR